MGTHACSACGRDLVRPEGPVRGDVCCPACGHCNRDPAPEAAASAPLHERPTGPPRSLPDSETAARAPGRGGIPGYEILSELGRGGMGIVYKARQTGLGRVVALKMILAGSHAEAADVLRFKTEAQAIARLQHANIVQVYEVGDCDGLPFFSLEFCPGGSLERKLKGTPLPPPEAAELVEKLARAMHAAHQAQVIHRDLKPANVLLAEDGTPKITDFGLARKLDEAGPTVVGAIMGTPSYMAPEQAGGGEVGPSADVYALGALLYELLTGRPPFLAATALDTILQVLHDEPVPPTRLQPKAPRDVEIICLKCLQKDPRRRYAGARDLAEDLRRFVAGEPIRARPVGMGERAAKWMRRRPAAAVGLVVGLAALTVLVGGGFWLQAERGSRVAGDLRARLQQEELARQEAELARRGVERDAQAKLAEERRWQSLLDQARGERLEGNRWKSLALLAEAARIRRTPEAEQEAFRAAVTPGARLLCEVMFLHPPDRALSPDGRYLLLGGHTHEDKDLVVGTSLWPLPAGPPVWHPSRHGILGPHEREWLPGAGAQFVRMGERTLLGLHLYSPQKKGEPARARQRHRLDLWDPATREVVSTLVLPDVPRSSRFFVDPAGKRLIWDDLVFDLRHPGPPTRLPAPARVPLGGDEMALGRIADEAGKPVPGARLVRWDLAAGREVSRFPEGKDVLAVSADGHVAVLGSPRTAGVETAAELWDVRAGRRIGEPVALRPAVPGPAPPDRLSPFQLSGDGRWLAVEGKTAAEGIVLRDGRTGLAVWTLPTPAGLGGAYLGPFAPGGDLLPVFAESQTRALELWDVEARRKLARLEVFPDDFHIPETALEAEGPPRLNPYNVPLWSNDGRLLLTTGWGSFVQPHGRTTSPLARQRVWEVVRLTPTCVIGRQVRSLRFSPDGLRLAVGGEVWTVRRPGGRIELARPAEAEEGEMTAFTADGLRVVQLPPGPSPDPVAVVVRTADRRFLVSLPRPAGTNQRPALLAAAGLSPTGRFLCLVYGTRSDAMSGARRFAYLVRSEMWDLQGREPVLLWKNEETPKDEFSHRREMIERAPVTFIANESALIVSEEPAPTLVLDTATGKRIGEPLHAPGAHWTARAASLDGKRIYFGGLDGTLYGIADSSPLFRAQDHKGEVSCLALGVGDRLLASGGEDRSIRLWDPATGRAVAAWQAHDREVTALAFTPDGRCLISAGLDGTLKGWDLARIAADLEAAGLGWQLPAGVRWKDE